MLFLSCLNLKLLSLIYFDVHVRRNMVFLFFCSKIEHKEDKTRIVPIMVEFVNS